MRGSCTWMKKANGIDELKQLIANFVEHRSPIPGGCPVLNTAVDADDGNLVLRARVAKALRSWVGRVQAFVEQAQEERNARPRVDPKVMATLIVASLEGAFMMRGFSATMRPCGTFNRI